MKRLLYIAHRVPYPPDKGERLRAFQEIRALSASFEITLAALSHSRSDRQAAEPLKHWCRELLLAPAGGLPGLARGGAYLLAGRSITEGFFHSARLRRLLRHQAERKAFDLAFAYCSSVLPLALAVPASRRVIDLVDVDSAKWAAYCRDARWPARTLYRMECKAVARLEQRAIDHCDAVFVVSRAEAGALDGPSEKVQPVGNGVDSEYFAPGAAAGRADLPSPCLVFTGSMDYRPNVDGVCWFVREVWPQLRRTVPGLGFAIVGRDPALAVRKLADTPGVVVTGSVPDVRPYLNAAALAVAPLRVARGVQNKVLEAMAMEKPVVASSAALEGLDVSIGRDVLRADSPEDWRNTILRLLGAPHSAEALARSARECVVTRYNWAAQLAPMLATCERLAGQGPPGPAAMRQVPDGATGPAGQRERREAAQEVR